MELFFSDKIENGYAELSSEESNHCIKILRHKAADIIHFTDGKGCIYDGRIDKADAKKCLVYILNRVNYTQNPYFPHIAIAPPKSLDRIEYFVEKSIEIGVNEITFLKCQRSERKEVKLDRLIKVAVAAIKQSKRAYLPTLNPIVDFKSFVNHTPDVATRYIASLGEHSKVTPREIYNTTHHPLVLIGPEGDFTHEEAALAIEKKFQPLSLGNAILRTETAGLVACCLMNFANNSYDLKA